ncbi:lipoprotein [Caballeronia udeis]|uniref:Lipoprotein n=1 Tax=Caballeronia udeis TaxID=1232866 RepID=A0A158HRX6_9BURK|nr:PqiC family protein [Caballeronia udeis]SAL47135.1 lipoprotein [Caballeronia udeis]
MRFFLLSLSVIGLGSLSGCATSPESKFYTLNAVPVVEQSPKVARVAIAIDPVTVPELIDRSQIVTRVDANRVSIDEFARWAELLKSQIPRVLAADLEQFIPGAIVSTYPQRVDDNAYRVSVDVQRFDTSMSGAVTLAVIWSARPPNRGERVSGRSVVHEAADGPGYDALVKAHSRALASVASDIAAAMRSAMGP